MITYINSLIDTLYAMYIVGGIIFLVVLGSILRLSKRFHGELHIVSIANDLLASIYYKLTKWHVILLSTLLAIIYPLRRYISFLSYKMIETIILHIPSPILVTLVGASLTFFTTLLVNDYIQSRKTSYITKSTAKILKVDLDRIIIALIVQSSVIGPSADSNKTNISLYHKITYLSTWESLLRDITGVLTTIQVKKIYDIYTKVIRHNTLLSTNLKALTIYEQKQLVADISYNDSNITKKSISYTDLSFWELEDDLKMIIANGRPASAKTKKIIYLLKYAYYRAKYSKKIEGFIINYLEDNNLKSIDCKVLENVIKKSEEFEVLFYSKLKYPSEFLLDTLMDSDQLKLGRDEVSLKK